MIETCGKYSVSILIRSVLLKLVKKFIFFSGNILIRHWKHYEFSTVSSTLSKFPIREASRFLLTKKLGCQLDPSTGTWTVFVSWHRGIGWDFGVFCSGWGKPGVLKKVIRFLAFFSLVRRCLDTTKPTLKNHLQKGAVSIRVCEKIRKKFPTPLALRADLKNISRDFSGKKNPTSKNWTSFSQLLDFYWAWDIQLESLWQWQVWWWYTLVLLVNLCYIYPFVLGFCGWISHDFNVFL